MRCSGAAEAGIDGVVAVAPEQQGWGFRDEREHRLELGHVGKPGAHDGENVGHGARNAEPFDVRFEATFGDAGGIAIHAIEPGLLEAARQIGADPRGQPANRGGEDADQPIAAVAEGIGGREQDEAANAAGMTGGEHHGHCTAVRNSGNIGLGETEGVQGCGEPVGGGFEACV